ncbi:hypothetical protein [Crocosphaera sp.]|uniref:hypothetical protein n=1 Tax=Crocosphaera sp. TaxID=2729996 RepID=UPI003F28267C|nr:hypothetical protein [Crocosphaera sp.]
MSLLEVFHRLISNTHNPELDEARKRHDNLPKTDYGKDAKLSLEELEKEKNTTRKRGYQLGIILKAAIEEHYSLSEQKPVKDAIMQAMSYLAIKARIFPDMDYQNIWYTDYYDIIELAKDMNLGDDTLPHWPEESNSFKRYLELSSSDLVQIFLSFSEEALLEEYKFKANKDHWIKYVLRETLKTRKRFAREKQKEKDTIRFSPDILKKIEKNKIQ